MLKKKVNYKKLNIMLLNIPNCKIPTFYSLIFIYLKDLFFERNSNISNFLKARFRNSQKIKSTKQEFFTYMIRKTL